MRIYSVTQKSGGAPRQAPTSPPCRKPPVQPEVVLPADRGLVHVAAQDVQQLLREARLAPTLAQAVVHPPAIPARLDKPDSAEPPEMPGDLVLRHPEGIHQLADAQLLAAQEAHQAEAGGVGQSSQKPGEILHRRIHATRYASLRIYIPLPATHVNEDFPAWHAGHPSQVTSTRPPVR